MDLLWAHRENGALRKEVKHLRARIRKMEKDIK
jgi:hypothetical protein